MYKHSPSPKLYYSTILSAWSKSGAEWQWKGTAEIDEIKLFSDYIQIKLGYRKESNMNFSNTGYYRFTVGDQVFPGLIHLRLERHTHFPSR